MAPMAAAAITALIPGAGPPLTKMAKRLSSIRVGTPGQSTRPGL